MRIVSVSYLKFENYLLFVVSTVDYKDSKLTQGTAVWEGQEMFHGQR
jgi:hypothetical protein